MAEFTEEERREIHAALDAAIDRCAARRMRPGANGGRLIVPPAAPVIETFVRPEESAAFVREFFGERAP